MESKRPAQEKLEAIRKKWADYVIPAEVRNKILEEVDPIKTMVFSLAAKIDAVEPSPIQDLEEELAQLAIALSRDSFLAGMELGAMELGDEGRSMLVFACEPITELMIQLIEVSVGLGVTSGDYKDRLVQTALEEVAAFSRQSYEDGVEYSPKHTLSSQHLSNASPDTSQDDQAVADDQNLTMAMLNEKAEMTGSVTRLPDGRHMIGATAKSDFSSTMLSMFLIFAEDVLPQDRITFSRWAELPITEWTEQHRETFAVVLYHYMLEAVRKGSGLRPSHIEAASMLSETFVQPLKKALSPDVTKIFERMFG